MRASMLTAILLFVCSLHAHDAGWGQAPPAKTQIVLIQGFKYQPQSLEVSLGDTVEWKNADVVAHTVTAADKSFSSGNIAPGAIWKYAPRKAGTFYYTCTPHPNMKAKLVVH